MTWKRIHVKKLKTGWRHSITWTVGRFAFRVVDVNFFIIVTRILQILWSKSNAIQICYCLIQCQLRVMYNIFIANSIIQWHINWRTVLINICGDHLHLAELVSYYRAFWNQAPIYFEFLKLIPFSIFFQNTIYFANVFIIYKNHCFNS